MCHKLSIFSIIFVALATMPFSSFGDLPKGTFLDEWMNEEFCAENSRSHGMNCNEKTIFSCGKFANDFSHKRSLFNNINGYLIQACKEDSTTLFSNIMDIGALGDSVRMVECEIGYVHPTGVYLSHLRCIPAKNYSKQEHENCISESGCSFIKSESNGSATYSCTCDTKEPSHGTNQLTPQVTEIPEEAQTIAHAEYNEELECPKGTKKEGNSCKLIVQGPFPQSECHNGPFLYFPNIPQQYKTEHENNFKSWQEACRAMANTCDAKHATEMEWTIAYRHNDGSINYGCVPKTCATDYPVKKESGCEQEGAAQNNELETQLKTDIEALTTAFNEIVKSITDECTKKGGTIQNDGMDCIVPEKTTEQSAQSADNKQSKANNRSANAKGRKGKK